MGRWSRLSNDELRRTVQECAEERSSIADNGEWDEDDKEDYDNAGYAYDGAVRELARRGLRG